MEVGDIVKMDRRGYPIGEIIKEVPKHKSSDKRLFTVKFNIIDEENYTTTECYIHELTLQKSKENEKT